MFIRLVCNLCDGYFVKESPRSSKLAFAKKGDLVDCTCSACGEQATCEIVACSDWPFTKKTEVEEIADPDPR